MSQVDTLLDLGELSSTPATSNTTTTTTTITADGNGSLSVDSGDPFDPFAVATTISSPNKPTSVDPFDPFAQIPNNNTTNGNLDSLDHNLPSPKSPPTTLIAETDVGTTSQDDVIQADLLGDYLVSTDTKKQDYLFSDNLTSPSSENPLYDMSMSSLTDITPPKAYLDDDLLNSPLDGPTSNGDGDPFMDLSKSGDGEVAVVTESHTDADGSFTITRMTTVTTDSKVAGQEAQFDDLLDDLDSSSPPPISSAPPEAHFTPTTTFSFSEPQLSGNPFSTVSSDPFAPPESTETQGFNPFVQVNSDSYTSEISDALSPVENSTKNNPFRIDSANVVVIATDPDDLVLEKNGNLTDSFDRAYESNVPVIDEMSNSDILSPLEPVSSPDSNENDKCNQEPIVDMIKNATSEIPVAPVTITTSVVLEDKNVTSPKSESVLSESVSSMSAYSGTDVTSPAKEEVIITEDLAPVKKPSEPEPVIAFNTVSSPIEQKVSADDLTLNEPQTAAPSTPDHDDIKSPSSVTSPISPVEVRITPSPTKITPTPAPRSKPPSSLSSSQTKSDSPNAPAGKKTPEPEPELELDVDPITGMIVPRRPKPAFLQDLLTKKEEEEEAAVRESVTSPFSQDGSTGSEERAKSPADHVYDSLPDVQMPKRFTKPDEKDAKNAPKVLIMSDSEELNETQESTVTSAEAQQDSEFYTSTTEYETEPSQPFGSLLSTWESNTEGGLPSEKTPVQSYLKPKEQTNKEQVQVEPTEIVRAEDKVEDDLESLPHIGNLRSRFEVKDKTPPPLEDKKPAKFRQTWASSQPEPEVMEVETTRVNGVEEGEEIAREKRGREEVGSDDDDIHFEQLNSIRSRFENIASQQKDAPHLPPQNQRSPSKWERGDMANRRESASPVNEESEGPDDLPAPEQTKGLVARFRQLEVEADQELIPERKPVRKITPPRQDIQVQSSDLERDVTPERDPNIIRHDDPNPEEEQMPPAAITKNLLAKFKSLEKPNEEPPSPALSALKQKAALNKPKYVTHSKAAVFESAAKEPEPPTQEADVKPLVQAVEHGVFENTPNERPELMRETDEIKEDDLPPIGATKSLLAQWKSMETVADASKDVVPTPKKRYGSSKLTPGRNSELSRSSESLSSKETISVEVNLQDQQVEATGAELVREADTVDDKEAIPPAFTRNLVAKFQQLSDSDREVTPPPSKKKQTPGSKKRTYSSPAYDTTVTATTTTETHRTPQRKWSQPDHYNQQPEPEIEPELEPEIHQSEEIQREIVRAEDPADHEDELPPPAFTKNLLARFKSMEDLSRPAPSPELDIAVKKSLAVEKKRELDPNRRKSSPAGMFPAKLTPHKIDYDEQKDHLTQRQQPEGDEYANGHDEIIDQQLDSGDSENMPVTVTDVVRETDNHFEEELPEVGTTRNLLAKFQSLTQQH